MSNNSPDLSRILITGADGMIGRAIPWGIKTDKNTLDVTDPAAIQQAITDYQPTALLHLAAIDIHAAEKDPFLAHQVNTVGTYHIAQAAQASNLPVFFLSSGALFNGSGRETHDETSQPQPINIFGQTKYLSEIILQSMLEKILIIRTGWVFGGHQAHHRKFVDIALAAVRDNKPLTAMTDQCGSPTYVHDLISAVEALIATPTYGIRHVVNDGVASAWDMAQEIAGILKKPAVIEPGSALTGGIRRPASEGLRSQYQTLRPWPDALREYILTP